MNELEDDLLEEEMQIAAEQDSGERILGSSTFEEPISSLGLPPLIAMEEDSTVFDAVKIMQEKRVGSVVITKQGKLSGIITERDILMKVVGKSADWKSEPVTKIMTPDPETLHPEDMIAFILNNMHVGGYRHVPIVNADHIPISMISIKDIVSFVFDHFPESITNITSQPHRGDKCREGA